MLIMKIYGGKEKIENPKFGHGNYVLPIFSSINVFTSLSKILGDSNQYQNTG